MSRFCYLVLDQGSSSSRALAVGPSGEVLAMAQRRLGISYPGPGLAEHDAAELLESQFSALREALAALPAGVEVRGLGLAAQRSTFVLWDRTTGRALGPALSWQDGRAASLLGSISLSNAAVHSVTGLYKTPYYSASKIRWCLDNYPAAAEAAAAGRLLAGPVTSYLLWHLTGGGVFAADPTSAQRTLLFDIRKMRWDARLLKEFGVPASVLPAIMPTAADYGEVRVDGRSMPVLASMGDQQAAILGLGVSGPGAGALNYGTGAFLLVSTGDRIAKIPGLLNSVGWDPASGGTSYFLEATVNSSASALDWLRQKFGLFSGLEEVDSMCRASRNRLLALPAIGGIGAPYWDFDTFTTFTGFSPHSDRNDVVRACVEGIAFMLADSAELARAKGFGVDSLRASGGLSSVDWLLQFQADVCGVPVTRAPQKEATALGAAAAMHAYLGGSPFPALSEPGRTFSPRLPSAERAALLGAWRGFMKGMRRISLEMRKLKVLPHD